MTVCWYGRIVVMACVLWGTAALCVAENSEQPAVTVQVTAQQHARLPIMIVLIDQEHTNALHEFVEQVGRDIAFSGQFAPGVMMVERVPTKKEILVLAQQGYPLVIFINEVVSAKTGKPLIEWRLYDAMSTTMIKGKAHPQHGTVPRVWAHEVADALWPVLTGSSGCFSSRIAYCKEVRRSTHKRMTHIYIADYDGSYPERFITTATINMAPRWNSDATSPLLFYSQGTNTNIRLMCADLTGKQHVAANFDGVNMLPSFSGDGKKAVFCSSRGDGNCQIYYYEKGTLKRVTHNEGNNLSPTLAHDGSCMFFCCDALTGKPGIYRYDFGTKTQTPIATTGFNFCPAYNQIKGLVAYSKLVGGQAQLFLYDEHTGVHEQLTHDKGNKDECCWSPCGSYLLFCVDGGSASRLALMNLATRAVQYLTPEDERCTYPTWSPQYAAYPQLTIQKEMRRD